MSAELFVDVTSSDLTIALLENKRLVELRVEKSDVQFAVGDIYLAKVKKIMPGLNAAFVDVGYEKDAFLHYLDLGPQFNTLQNFLKESTSKKGAPSLSKFNTQGDILKDGTIADVLSAGQEVLVQVAKEPISTKGPRLTSELSLAGRNLVLMPFADKVSISQKIESNEERLRLKKMLYSIKPKNYGIIVRTVAEGKKLAELEKELKVLVKRWEDATLRLKDLRPPSLVVSEIGRTTAILRDILNPSFNNIYINNHAVYSEVKEYVSLISPEREDIVKEYIHPQSIFEHFGIEKQVKLLFGKTVSFKSGAYLIIEHTEALHVIDVNSGNRTKSSTDQETNALEVNLAAADEIGRQLRLRDMGGIIVVDFIDMQLAENKVKLFDRMKEAMSTDRTKHNILPLSKFGIMQITRQRVRPELHIVTQEVCPTCLGTGKATASINMVDKIEEGVEFAAKNLKLDQFTVKVHSFIGAYFTKGLFSKAFKWKLKYGFGIKIESSDSVGFLDFKIFDKNQKEVIL